MSCSINGKVKNIFLPPPEVRIGSAISSPLADEWLFRVVPRDCSRPSHRFTVLAATTPSDPETHKRYGCSVATMVLSETRGLVLFRVIRGGIGLTQRLGVVAPSAYRTSAYSPSTPNVARVDSPTVANGGHGGVNDGPDIASEARRLGASGYLLKTSARARGIAGQLIYDAADIGAPTRRVHQGPASRPASQTSDHEAT